MVMVNCPKCRTSISVSNKPLAKYKAISCPQCRCVSTTCPECGKRVSSKPECSSCGFELGLSAEQKRSFTKNDSDGTQIYGVLLMLVLPCGMFGYIVGLVANPHDGSTQIGFTVGILIPLVIMMLHAIAERSK